MKYGWIDSFWLARLGGVCNTFLSVAYLSLWGDSRNRFYYVLYDKQLGMWLIHIMAVLCLACLLDIIVNDWWSTGPSITFLKRWRSTLYMSMALSWASLVFVMVESRESLELFPFVAFKISYFVMIAVADVGYIKIENEVRRAAKTKVAH